MIEELFETLCGVVRSEDLPPAFAVPLQAAPNPAPPPVRGAFWTRLRQSWTFYGFCALASAGLVRVVAHARAAH